MRSVLILLVVWNVVFKILPGRKLANQVVFEEVIRNKKELTAIDQPRRLGWRMDESMLLPVDPAPTKALCSREQILGGSWSKVILDKAPYIPPNNPKLMCGSKERYQQDKFDTHEWRPHDETCDFMPWDRNLFCDLTRNETVLFMGDSLSQEAMFSFGELMGLRTSPDDNPGSPVYSFGSACNRTVQAVFRRQDFLRPSMVAWELADKAPMAAVLNRGAHFVDDEQLLQEMNETISHVREWQTKCTDAGRRCLLVWRTTVPGHPQCPSYTEPAANSTDLERLIDDHGVSRRYHWHEFQRQNLLVEQVLSESGVDYEMLDAYHLNILRPDMHRVSTYDCLHSCLDSKLDVYSQVLLHILRKFHREADESEMIGEMAVS